MSKLPRTIYKVDGKKQKCTVDFKLEELRCGKNLKRIRFVDMPEDKNSKIKKKLRGIRSRTWHSDYIRGLDD